MTLNFLKSLKLLFISFIIIQFYNCSHNFSEDFYNDINIPSTEDNSIEIINFNKNDIINDFREMEYHFSGTPNQNILTAEVYINNEKVYSSYQGNKGRFTIYPSKLDDGEHSIRIKLTFSSGSGSINDQLNQEVLTKIKESTFVVNRKPSLPPSINEVLIENGSITIKWGDLDKENYDKAFLSLTFKNKNRRIPLSKEDLISKTYIDKTTVLFEDNTNSIHTAHQSQVIYSIVFTNKYTERHGEGKLLKYESSWLKIKLSYIDNNSYKLVWDKYPLYNNFNEFSFTHRSKTFKGASIGGEYIINTPYILGDEYSCIVRPIVPHSYMPITIWELDLDKNSFGLFDHDNLYSLGIVFNPNTQKYYALVGESKTGTKINYAIYEYSKDMKLLRKNNVIKNEIVDVIFSKKALHLNPYTYNFHVETREGTYEINKSTLEATLKYTNNGDIGYRHMVRGNILLTQQISNGRIELKNLVTNKIIFSSTVSVSAVLSNDGKYLQVTNSRSEVGSIYKITGDTIEKINDVDHYRVYFYKQLIFYQKKGQVFMKDIETNAVTSFMFGTEPKIEYDPISNKILLQQNGYNAIYDVATKSIKKFHSEHNKHSQYPFSNEDRSYRLHLQNNRLIHTKGIFIDNY